ncbi:MAG: sugar ABC transporter permease [Chloroflexi bacterium HGW-Chloroflexi-10]|nr:MAG: sugar ABC transporter permease [Chloroflexi bacterium HGW-Chloroflexi-10]
MLFSIVPLAIYTIIVIIPLLSSFYYSFTDWNGFRQDYNWVGFDNYAKVFRDNLFIGAIKNTLIWMVAAVILPVGGGLSLALLLHEGIWGANFYKSLFYLPICLSLAVIGQVWIWIYQPNWGLINTILRDIHLDHLTMAWLANPQTALASVIAAWSWQQIGLAMVIFLAGLTSIPSELTEAAEIDGATYLQSLYHVVIPLLSPATVVIIALSIINSLKSFDIVYMMTQGGPFHTTDTLAMFMYNESFKKYYMGYGSAIAVVLFLIAMVIIAFYFRQVRELEHLYD